jgi:hypothetical protein
MPRRPHSKAGEIPSLITQARAEAAQVMAECPRARARITRLIQFLGEIEDAWHDAGPSPKRAARSSRGATISGYAVEEWQGEEHLVEERDSGAQPFRTPRSHFDAVVEILAAAGEAMRFEEIRKLAVEQLGLSSEDELPIYRLRIVMRFLNTHGLLVHEARRYRRVGSASSFLKAAAKAWNACHAEPRP